MGFATCALLEEEEEETTGETPLLPGDAGIGNAELKSVDEADPGLSPEEDKLLPPAAAAAVSALAELEEVEVEEVSETAGEARPD